MLPLSLSFIGWRVAVRDGLKHLVRSALAAAGYEIHALPRAAAGGPQYSTFDEQAIIRRYVDTLQLANGWCVDIGAGDGRTSSNTYALFAAGWKGLAIEAETVRFAQLAAACLSLKQVGVARCRVTPDNICTLLRGYDVPRDFGVLSIDIDSYDYFVLERVLQEYRPSIICAEINVAIPPPVQFAVKWTPGFAAVTPPFFGQSLSQLAALAKSHDYALVELHYTNAFLIRGDQCVLPRLTPEDAYRTGYADRPDRLARLPWYADMEPLQRLSGPEAAQELVRRFKQHAGRFVCTVPGTGDT